MHNLLCTRRLEFDAAHRIIGHEGRCKNLHGHRYVVEITFAAEELSSTGMIIDFALIKQKLGRWIEVNWDHNTILAQEDQALGQAIKCVTGQSVFYLNSTPTAENIAKYLLYTVCNQLFKDDSVICLKTKVYETPNCYSECISS